MPQKHYPSQLHQPYQIIKFSIFQIKIKYMC